MGGAIVCSLYKRMYSVGCTIVNRPDNDSCVRVDMGIIMIIRINFPDLNIEL